MYVVNNFIDIDLPSLELSQLTSVKESTLVVLLNAQVSEDTYNYYTSLLKALRQENTIILINTDTESKNRYLLYNLLISNGQYGIYETDTSIIDKEYIEYVVKANPTIEDVACYIDKDTSYYATTCDLLLKMNEAIENQDDAALLDFIKAHKNLMLHTLECIQYFQGLLEYYLLLPPKEVERIVEIPANVDIQAMDEYKELETQMNLLKLENEQHSNLLATLEEENTLFKQELAKLQSENAEYIQKLYAQPSVSVEDMNTLTAANKELTDKVATLVQELSSSTTLSSDLETQIRGYKLELEELKKAKISEALKKPQASDTTEQLLVLEDINKDLKTQLEFILEELEASKIQFEDLQAQNTTYKQQLDLLSIENTKHLKKLSQIDTDITSSDQFKELIEEKETLVGQVTHLTQDLADANTHIEDLETKNATYKQEIVSLKDENEDFLTKLNLKGPTIKSYAPIRLSNIRQKAKTILYFKEISYVSYTNTLITIILDTMARAKIKAKLVIYDNSTDFNIAYTNVAMISGGDYLKMKDQVLNQLDRFVVTEHTTQILEDVLKSELDLVIIYDRLKKDRDLIQGNFAKFWVINSQNGILATQNLLPANAQIPLDSIITRPGVQQGTIALPEIADYSRATDSARLSNWLGLCNVNSPNQERIVQKLAQRAGIALKTNRNR